MRLAVLTSVPRGTASRCLPALVASPELEIAGVVLARGVTDRRWRHRWRKLKKIARIGPLGALVGWRMRAWYAEPEAEDVRAVCRRLGVPLLESSAINHPRTFELLRGLAPDLGLVLGAGYVGRRVFEVPRHGMINVHGEVLPRYQGAASVVWAIHDGLDETGFAIHRLDDRIDTGDVLHVERFPIAWRPTLEETVRASVARFRPRVAPALVRVCEDWDGSVARAEPQPRGRSYTTPTFREYRRMMRMHRRMWAEAQRARAAA